MIIAILGSIAAIAALCWLLFMLATYALPALGGVAAGMWAYQTGAGLPGSVLVGLVGGVKDLLLVGGGLLRVGKGLGDGGELYEVLGEAAKGTGE